MALRPTPGHSSRPHARCRCPGTPGPTRRRPARCEVEGATGHDPEKCEAVFRLDHAPKSPLLHWGACPSSPAARVGDAARREVLRFLCPCREARMNRINRKVAGMV